MLAVELLQGKGCSFKLHALQGGRSLDASSIVFENNYAMNPDLEGMPTKDVTIELWARTPAYDNNALGHNPLADLLTYATHIPEAESFCGSPILTPHRLSTRSLAVPVWLSSILPLGTRLVQSASLGSENPRVI